MILEAVNKKKDFALNTLLHNPRSADYLIKQRRKVGKSLDYANISPEELEQAKLPHPNYTLIPPGTPAASLQRFVLLRYDPDENIEELKDQLKKTKGIAYIGINRRISFSSIYPNDPLAQYAFPEFFQWNLSSLNLGQAWELQRGYAYVGVFDSGIQTNHYDLVENFRPQFSWNFDQNSSSPDVEETGFLWNGIEYRGHGTHVAGIIAASTDNGLGTAGICWLCSLMIGKGDAVAGVKGLSDFGAQLINMSWGKHDCDEPVSSCLDLALSIRDAHNRDIVLVAASGNGEANDNWHSPASGLYHVDYPASDPRVIAVGASDFLGQRAFFSNYGNTLDLLAPGATYASLEGNYSGIWSSVYTSYDWNPAWSCGDTHGIGNYDIPDDGLGWCMGTSMAAPHVTGLAALIRSVNPLLPKDAVKDILIRTASHAGNHDIETGYGIPNAAAALDEALGTVGGNRLENRLTPLYAYISLDADGGETAYADGQDHFYTTVPQMGVAALQGTMPPQLENGPKVSYVPLSSSASGTSPLIGGPTLPMSDLGEQPIPQVLAHIFTSDRNPDPYSSAPLLPLYRLSYQGNNSGNNPDHNVDHIYLSDNALLATYQSVGYKLDGIEGYVYPADDSPTKPVGSVGLWQGYNISRDDHALFLGTAGDIPADYNHYVMRLGNVYPHVDSDQDGLVDGFELLIGTCPNNPDTNNDGEYDNSILNYDFVNGQGYGDPGQGSCSDAWGEYPWQARQNGNLVQNNYRDYAMGYHFTPDKDGAITQLCAFFNSRDAAGNIIPDKSGSHSGTRRIKLFGYASGNMYRSAELQGNNSWQCAAITPFSVLANHTYTVALYLENAGAAYLTHMQGTGFTPLYQLNLTDGSDITIHGSTNTYTGTNPDARPTVNYTHIMYGQVDIRFRPNP